MNEQQTGPIVLTAFIRGLRGHSASLARKVRNSNPANLEQALEKAQFILSDPFDEPHEQGNDVLALAKNGETVEVSPEEEEYLHSAPSKESVVQSSVSKPPAWLPDVINAIRKANTCDYCGKQGHEVSNCFKKMRDEGVSPVPRRPTRWVDLQPRKRQRQGDYREEYPKTPGALCTYCARMNHTAEQCIVKKRAEALKKQMSSENC
ncbi:paraneoplastic Ma antigen [Perkinsus olseni]|uniref:Paraneoplastic Ma antigen n=1 Tax=Perkinsus olseni TaxID=32597 RepID=A0A7J6TDV0_PEROL|nr:paraneoplastic Ma antigen [Perkinsus olseni]